LLSIKKMTNFAAVKMKSELDVFKNVPVQTAAIASLYPDIKAGKKKVASLEKANKIIRLKRGLYVVNPKESGLLVSTELIGNMLYGPSYVSMMTALRFYGLIPEYVAITESMTIHLRRTFDTPLGRFEYYHCSKEYYQIGIRQEATEGINFLMATPEKALCDYICATPYLPLRFIKDTYTFLEEDLRFDMDAFVEMDISIFKQCAATGKKQQFINNIIKLKEKL